MGLRSKIKCLMTLENSQASFLWNCEVRHAISAGILERGFWLLQVGVKGDHIALNGLPEANFCSATLVGRNVLLGVMCSEQKRKTHLRSDAIYRHWHFGRLAVLCIAKGAAPRGS
jgi:hypothetical protein